MEACPWCGRPTERLSQKGRSPQYHLECRRVVDALSMLEDAMQLVRYASKERRAGARKAVGSLVNRTVNGSPVDVTDGEHAQAMVVAWRRKMDRRKSRRVTR